MNNEKLYRHEFIFSVVGIIVAFIIRILFPFELFSVFVVNLIIYWLVLTFSVVLLCFVVYAYLMTLVSDFRPRVQEKVPDERKLSPRNFHQLNSIIVTTLVAEKIYGATQSWEWAIVSIFFVFWFTYKLSYVFSRLRGSSF